MNSTSGFRTCPSHLTNEDLSFIITITKREFIYFVRDRVGTAGMSTVYIIWKPIYAVIAQGWNHSDTLEWTESMFVVKLSYYLWSGRVIQDLKKSK